MAAQLCYSSWERIICFVCFRVVISPVMPDEAFQGVLMSTSTGGWMGAP